MFLISRSATFLIFSSPSLRRTVCLLVEEEEAELTLRTVVGPDNADRAVAIANDLVIKIAGDQAARPEQPTATARCIALRAVTSEYARTGTLTP